MLQITVGMAVYDNPPFFWESVRAWFTAMDLQIHHHQVNEVVIVDNNPHPDNPLVRMPADTGGFVKYVPMPEPKGTAPPRNRVFFEAKNDHVMCIDPHVLIYPKAFDYVEQFYIKNGLACQDILHGPLMTGRRNQIYATHMNDQWRCQMWGTWGIAWQRPGSNMIFSTMTEDEGKTLLYVTVPQQNNEEQRPLTASEMRALGLERLDWSGHEPILEKQGFEQPSKPYRIPGHGMGLFMTRRDVWAKLGFHPKCRGFGGEEMTTGERFRQNNLNVWCIPQLKWWHHFERFNGSIVPYAMPTWDKIRNYVLEFERLGYPLDEVKEHFRSVIPDSEWKQLINGADWPEQDSSLDGVYKPNREQAADEMKRHGNIPIGNTRGVPMQQRTYTPLPDTIDAYYVAARNRNDGLQHDLPILKYVAGACGPDDDPGIVVELAHQSVSKVAFLAGGPVSLYSYGCPKNDPRIAKLKTIVYSKPTNFYPISGMVGRKVDYSCDCLFICVQPVDPGYYLRLMETYIDHVRRYILVHQTKKGTSPAVTEFLLKHKDWHLVGQNVMGHGMAILSKRKADSLNFERYLQEVAHVA